MVPSRQPRQTNLTPTVDCAVAVLGRGCIAQGSGPQSTAVRSLLVKTYQPTNQRANWGRTLEQKRKSMSLGLCSHSCVNRIAGLRNRHLKL